MEFTLLAAAVVSAATVYAVVRARRPAADRGGPEPWDTALAAGMAGLFVGRVAAMILAGTNPLTHLTDLLVVRSGVDTGWASLAALATAVAVGRRDPVGTLDTLAAPALAGLAAWHGSCLVRGSCLGTPSGLPWAVAASGSEVARHPVELYAALALAAGAVAAAWWSRRDPRPGILGGGALFAAASVRLATEPLRPSLGTGPIAWYAAGMLAGIALLAGGRWVSRRSAG